MIYSWLAENPAGLEAPASEIIHLSTSRIFLLKGEMGAGKTTLTGYFLKALGCADQVQSPSFGLVNEYLTKAGAVYHFDFYRIASISEAFDIGVEEYFNSGHYCFIEWPEKIDALVPEGANQVSIGLTETNSRKIILEIS